MLFPLTPLSWKMSSRVLLLLLFFANCEGHNKREALLRPRQAKDRKNFPIILREPSYVVMAPRLIRPGQVYRMVVNILEPSPPLVVRASIYRDNIELASVEHECETSNLQVLEIMVPDSSTKGSYRLKLEGNEVGWLTGSAFTNETLLTYRTTGATVLVHTDRTVYKQGDVVYFRVVALDMSASMIQDSVDIFILSPRGVVVKRWLSRQCLEGAISLDFPLSDEPEFGKWTIRAEVKSVSSEHHFYVEYFEEPQFEVEVLVPPFLPADNDYLEGAIRANYSSGAPVAGNVTIRAAIAPIQESLRERYSSDYSLVQTYTSFSGFLNFKFLLSEFETLVSHTSNKEIKVTATVGDAYWDTVGSGYGVTRVHGSKILLKFMGGSPQVLRPPMGFKFFLTASQEDGSSVPRWRLHKHRLIVTPEVTLKTGETNRLLPRAVKMTHSSYGLWVAEIDLAMELGDGEFETNVAWLTLDAQLKDSTGRRTYANMRAIAHHSPNGRHLQVTTSTLHPKVGEYIILHVRSNFYLESFRFIVVSKGMVLQADQESMQASLKTFPIALTKEMAGTSTIIVYNTGRGNNEMVADSLTFPVDSVSRSNPEIKITREPRDDFLRVSITAEPNSRVFLTGSSLASYNMKISDSFSRDEILNKLSQFDEPSYERMPATHSWRSFPSSTFIQKPTSSSGIDFSSTFMTSDMVIMSDGAIPQKPISCFSGSRSQKQCLLMGCYSSSSMCDGKWDCSDGENLPVILQDADEYNLYQASRVSSHFSPPWIWKDLFIGDSGSKTLTISLPKKESHLVLSAFSVHPKSGLTLLSSPIEWQGYLDFWLWVEAPARIGIWEQVGIRVTLVNNRATSIKSIIILESSPAYKFVSIEEFGAAQLVGHTVEHHTSLLVDLVNRAYFFTFLDVNTSLADEASASSVHISVFGNTVGPALSPYPVTSEDLFGLPNVGCESVVFSFFMTALQLKHREELDQSPEVDKKEVFSHLARLYQTLLSYQNVEGGFKLYLFLLNYQSANGAWWEPSGSVPDRKFKSYTYSLNSESTKNLNISITAYVILNLMCLQQLPSPIDEGILTSIRRGKKWLEENVSLVERVSSPLEVALVALTLQKTKSTKEEASFAALARNSRQESPADERPLDSKILRRQQPWSDIFTVQYVYWGEDIVSLPSYRIEFQRPFLQPRTPNRHDAGNVAATAYALRVYCSRGEVMTPAIVRWLQSQRGHDGGWISTQDTIAAWEALYECSLRDTLKRVTELSVTIEPMDDHSMGHTFQIVPDNLLNLQKKEIGRKWGNVRVQSKGKGMAVLQLTSSYSVPPAGIAPFNDFAYSLNTRPFASGRNASTLSFMSCVRWLQTENSRSSGITVLEITLPTGYETSNKRLIQYVQSKKIPALREAKFNEKKIQFFLDKVDPEETCISFSLERRFPVANLSRILPVKVYEYYSPQIHAEELIDMSEVALDICQVCGSYQCPDCPVISYYSSRAVTAVNYTCVYIMCLVLLSIFQS